MSSDLVTSKGGVLQNAALQDADLPTDSDDVVLTGKTGTSQDRMDMYRMGKLQELRRNFRFISMFGYAIILGNSWEFALATGFISLINGGPAGAIWMFLVVACSFLFVTLSLAEMASMAPTAGGQFHWVSEFAPKEYQKLFSYLVGWLCVLGWQAGMAGTSYLTALQIEGLIALNMPSYAPKGWHGTLFAIAIVIIAILFNTVLIKKLPLVEDFMLVLHVVAFFAILVVLWVMADKESAHTTFTDFQDNAGWGNTGLACLVGLVGPIATLLGSDSACHLSEELRDASWTLPRTMVSTALVNYILGWVMTITVMSTLGNDDALFSFGQPYIYVLYKATKSRAGASILTATTILLLLFGCVNLVTTASRQLYAFARDKGLPFSSYLSYVRPGWDIPINSIILTMCITVILSFITIGSSIAFNNIISLSQAGLMTSYLIAIGCITRKRLRKETLLPSRFDLGRAGLAINIISLCVIFLFFIFIFFPTQPNPTLQTMNWCCLIYAAVVAFALGYYYFRGRHAYVGPVEYVTNAMS